MGLLPHPNGVTLKFVEKDGVTPRGPGSVFAKHVKFFSTPRVQLRGQPDPPSPGPGLGSKDWLTDVLVADTSAKLAAMKAHHTLDAMTSTSSLQVHVLWDTHDSSGEEQESVTLAPLQNLTQHPGDDRAFTDTLLVLPGDADIALLSVDPSNGVVIDALKAFKALKTSSAATAKKP